MTEPITGPRAEKRPRRRPNPYGELLHLLNRRYHQEWERAEALADKLARLRRWKILPLLEWLGRFVRRFRNSTSPSEPAFAAHASPYEPPADLPSPSGVVSIIIPFKDRPELLRNCLRSLSASTCRRFEVVLVDNGSKQRRTQRLLSRYGERPGVSVVITPGPFNFAKLCNRGAAAATGEHLLFLNNDTEVLDRDWLEQLLRVGSDPRVGAVGATLLYPDRTIQHAGMLPRADGVWVHPYRGRPANEPGTNGELRGPRSVSAVTAACLLIRRDLYREIGGFDEQYPVMYNDVDLCARLRARGLLVVVTPHARLVHYESLSRGYALDDPNRPAA
jgi:GT2 family glycosyltransferase